MMMRVDEIKQEKAEDPIGVIWDFDWSFVNENTDTFVIESLAPLLMSDLKALLKTTFKNRWTALMDHTLGCMMNDHNVSIDDLNECLCKVPLFEENIQALKEAQQRGALNFILSDANEHYINTILNHYDLASSFEEIETNKSFLEHRNKEQPSCLLRIHPHQSLDNPHNCSHCPENLCKGRVMEKWMEKYNFKKVIYVGDGYGDICPVLKLGPSDIVLCRENYPLHKYLNSYNRLTAEVNPWSNGKDILRVILKSLYS